MAQVIKKATRESFGMALCELAKTNKDIIVFDADLAAATKTGIFKKEFPERFFDCGIAEGNMVGVAALKISVLCVQFRVWLSLTLPITTK